MDHLSAIDKARPLDVLGTNIYHLYTNKQEIDVSPRRIAANRLNRAPRFPSIKKQNLLIRFPIHEFNELSADDRLSFAEPLWTRRSASDIVFAHDSRS